MAQKSKSTENKEKNGDAEEVEASDPVENSPEDSAESTGDAPQIIEGDATEEVEETPEELAATTDDEDEAAAESETEPSVEEIEPRPPVPAPVAEPARTGPSMMALVMGGVVAGAIGYFGAALAPKPQPEVVEFDATPLNDGIQANSDALAALSAEIEGLRAVPEVDLSGIEERLAGVTAAIDTLNADIAGLQATLDETVASVEANSVEMDERIIALETAVPGAGELATGDELAALRGRIEAMTAEAEARLQDVQDRAAALETEAIEARAAAEAKVAEAQAEAAARVAEAEAAAEAREAEAAQVAARQAALIDLKAAVETGAPYADTLAGVGDVPAVLAENAEAGVPALQSLQRDFPAAARLALASTEVIPEDASAGERFTAFLKRRTGARSLSPKEGDSPDAVLSRAEASLGEGDLETALNELEALPPEGRAAMSDWLEQAELRLSVVTAIDELTATN